MDGRERFHRTLDFQTVDKQFNHETGLWGQTIDRWQAEGFLPSDIHVDINFLWGNEHTLGKAAPYDNGMSRGQHTAGKLTYEFNKYVSGHLLAEYFHPETYYDSDRDDALFLRWQLMFKF